MLSSIHLPKNEAIPALTASDWLVCGGCGCAAIGCDICCHACGIPAGIIPGPTTGGIPAKVWAGELSLRISMNALPTRVNAPMPLAILAVSLPGRFQLVY